MTEILFDFDAKAAALLESYVQTGSASGLSFVEGKDKDKKSVLFTTTFGSLGGLLVSDFGHSVLCKLLTPEDQSIFESIEDTAAALFPESLEFKPFVKDEKFFMKLPHKADSYRATIDPSCVPSQPEKSPFKQGSQITVDYTVSLWVNYDNAQAGLFLNVFKVVVDGGKKRLNRKK